MRALIVAGLLFYQAVAWAEWVPMYSDAQVSHYADKSSVYRTPSGVAMWEKDVLGVPKRLSDGSAAKLLMILNEFDCDGRRSRVIALKVYADSLGKQYLKGTDSPASWGHIAPGSNDQKSFNLACSEYARKLQSKSK